MHKIGLDTKQADYNEWQNTVVCKCNFVNLTNQL